MKQLYPGFLSSEFFPAKINYQQFKSISADYQLTESDHGLIILANGDIVVTLPTSLPPGFQVIVFNEGTGTIVFSSTGTLQASGTTLTESKKAVHVCYITISTIMMVGALS